MNVNVTNPIAELRKITGYTAEQLSLVSGLTVAEIARIESGEITDEAKVERLFSAAGIAPGEPDQGAAK